MELDDGAAIDGFDVDIVRAHLNGLFERSDNAAASNVDVVMRACVAAIGINVSLNDDVRRDIARLVDLKTLSLGGLRDRGNERRTAMRRADEPKPRFEKSAKIARLVRNFKNPIRSRENGARKKERQRALVLELDLFGHGNGDGRT